MEIDNYWTPTAQNINELPGPLREYIYQLETRADPSGDVQSIALLKDTCEGLQARVVELERIYRHRHRAGEMFSVDRCALCGLDIRDSIHIREALEDNDEN